MREEETGTISKAELSMPDDKVDILFRIPEFDLLVAFTYIVIITGLIFFSSIPGISAVLPWIASGILFIVPGYMLLSLLFLRINRDDWMERIALSIGLSTMLSFLIFFSLKYFFFIDNIKYLILSITALSLVCIIATFIRRRVLSFAPGISLDIDRDLPYAILAFFQKPEGRIERFATVLLGLILLSLVLTTAYITIIPKQGEKFTEFYILGTDGKASNYPVTFSLGDQKPVILGITNHEYRNVAYNLIINLNDSNNITQMYSNSFSLTNNQTVEKTITLIPDHIGDKMKIEFNLYMDGNMTSPNRQLYLWVSVK